MDCIFNEQHGIPGSHRQAGSARPEALSLATGHFAHTEPAGTGLGHPCSFPMVCFAKAAPSSYCLWALLRLGCLLLPD